eukprot:TRINITY_DN2918_c0_g2_i1.p1 TRINITY_DN2918_c0_g2~~TRINITY_DN2918_c0_g2_i1.p1  ORF type:complete len:298 (-),score=23.63 TRINITY_DN2918_c0_g2_i1:28-921(-)
MDIVPIMTRLSVALITSVLLSVRGYRKKSLDLSGSVSAFVVGFITTCAGYRLACLLYIFFITSSLLTKYKGEKKRKIEEDFKEGGQRNWIQVLANGGFATALCLWSLSLEGVVQESSVELGVSGPSVANMKSILVLAVMGQYACVNGDTWSSELGILSTSNPILITAPWRRVPRGTNGGLSFLGCAASVMAGLCIGVTCYVAGLLFGNGATASVPQWPLIPLGCLAGFVGSLLDSLLGATIQYSGFCSQTRRIVSTPSATTRHISGWPLVDNDTVNFLSAAMTSLIVAWAGAVWFRV